MPVQQPDLFAPAPSRSGEARPAPGMLLFSRLDAAEMLVRDIAGMAERSPFRHMVTPGGHAMQVATTSCGARGWTSDRSGYRYAERDPLTGAPWPPMPEAWRALAQEAAARAGFTGFDPDSCLINRYAVGTRLSAHRDIDEEALGQPVVSVSLGLPGRFMLYGLERGGRAQPIGLAHGDVLVFGGPARLRYHAVAPIRPGEHPSTGPFRLNLTFRRARLG